MKEKIDQYSEYSGEQLLLLNENSNIFCVSLNHNYNQCQSALLLIDQLTQQIVQEIKFDEFQISVIYRHEKMFFIGLYYDDEQNIDKNRMEIESGSPSKLNELLIYQIEESKLEFKTKLHFKFSVLDIKQISQKQNRFLIALSEQLVIIEVNNSQRKIQATQIY